MQQILGAANVAQTMYVTFGLIGIFLTLTDCAILGGVCFAAFIFFAWARMSLEAQYNDVLTGRHRDEEP